MPTKKNAQQGVITAIYILERKGIFPDILKELRANVAPAYLRLVRKPRLKGAPRTVAATNERERLQASIAAYQAGGKLAALLRERQDRCRQRYDRALKAWIEKFHLTADGTSTGAPLEWTLKLVEEVCQDAVNGIDRRDKALTTDYLSESSIVGISSGPPSPEDFGLSISVKSLSVPRAYETFKEFWSRIQPEMKIAAKRLWKAGPKKSTRSKRNQVHYQWFVLRRCAGWPYPKIADSYAHMFPSMDESNLRKAVQAIETTLGLVRTGN